MALRRQASDPLAPILEEVAEAVARLGMKEGTAEGARAVLRIELEENVRRVVQAYWTAFEVSVLGRSVGLHLEVAEPTVHWAEGYLSPHVRSWYLAFNARDDGEVQLAHYGDYATWEKALEMFFDLSGWYVLTATGVTWDDVVFQVAPELDWSPHHRALAQAEIDKAVDEALKKSTIIWLRWDGRDGAQTMPVWFVQDQGKLYVLSGERQQTIPDAESIRECEVIVRWKGKNARVADIPASVRILDQDERWDEIAEKIAEKRLNIPGLPEETARRWRDECQILELSLRS